MAHGYMAAMTDPDTIAVYSAGVETHGLNPKAIAVMQEDGIDISSFQSNHVDEYREIVFDYVITVCDHAQERCPYVATGAHRLHHNFRDPAKAQGSDAEVMMLFRSVRDEIKLYCERFVNVYLNDIEVSNEDK